MSASYGPHLQMGKLAENLALSYQRDKQLVLPPLLSHFMDEVEVNIASDRFDHTAFLQKIRTPLVALEASATNPRKKEFLQALLEALEKRLQAEEASR